MAELRALTVRQPWGGCIAYLGKNIENRSKPFPPSLLGQDIAIHAGLSVDPNWTGEVPAYADFASLFASNAEWDAWRLASPRRTPRVTAAWPPKLILGAVVAVGKVTGCHPWSWDKLCGPEHEYTSPSTPGLCSPWVRLGAPWHWELDDVRPLATPVPCLGALGPWHLPEEVEAAVRAQLEVADA
jgi:hypothetical protein